ncbi:MAG: hypothetical protein IT269_12155, partial [Saprospiraceae bacterium]|nr:hypothetical protein [Saprospiraceae bacterium]
APAIVPYLWKECYCTCSDFQDAIYCNTADTTERYIIELSQMPFKDYVVLLIGIKKEDFDIKYTQIKYSDSDAKFSPKKNILQTVFPPQSDNKYYFKYTDFKKVNMGKDHLKTFEFLHKTIWEMPSIDTLDKVDFDAETWVVIGRKNGKTSKWTRTSFNDSLFYTSIQKILDHAKITEYSYGKR